MADPLDAHTSKPVFAPDTINVVTWSTANGIGALAEVKIIDLSGRLVRRLFAGQAASGAYDLDWDGRDESGTLLPVGIYLVRVEVDTERKNFVRLGSVGMVY